MNRFLLLYVVPLLLFLVFAVSSLIGGSETLYHRDVMSSHFPIKAAHAQVMEEGGVLPLIDPYRFGGQPLMGNPNAVPFYPSNLLYRLASPLWALNAHFWLHWLLAPFAMFWLARAWGLPKPAAWAAGVVYAGSGYFLSLLNLYNLVTGAVWLPAFAAACIKTAERRSPWPSVGLATTWALLLLAGDPMTALLGLALGISTWLARRPWQLRAAITSLAGSLGIGTLIAAPMWVELFRILPLSFRGVQRYPLGTTLAQSWNPWTSIEWIVPFCFGNLDYNFWGYSFFGGNPPLLYSLFPGVLAVALVVASRRPSTGRDFWCWGWIALGAFVSAGFYNPLMHPFYVLPGASALRYPIKCWILVAVAASILAAVGFERFLKGDRLLVKLLGVSALFYLALWGLLIYMPPALEKALRSLSPDVFTDLIFGHQRLQWATSTFFVLTACLMLWLAARQVNRRPPYQMGAVLLFLHIASQGFLLQPLYDSDDTEAYTRLPEIASDLPHDARLAHGTFGELFGPRDQSMFPDLPGPELFWLTREDFTSFGHYAGVPHGFKYELNFSPEGLDSFYSRAFGETIKDSDDLARVRLLAAVGTDRLFLLRRLDASTEPEVSLVATAKGEALETWQYALKRNLPELQLLGRVIRTKTMNQALTTMASPTFDPRAAAVLFSEGPELDAESGSVKLIAESRERLEVSVSSTGGGLLTTRRAWLPIYQASIDGRPAKAEIFNMYKLGVLVPPGDHRVVIQTDRRPTYAALVASLIGVFGLGLLLWRGKSDRSDPSPEPDTVTEQPEPASPDADGSTDGGPNIQLEAGGHQETREAEGH